MMRNIDEDFVYTIFVQWINYYKWGSMIFRNWTMNKLHDEVIDIDWTYI